MPVVTIAAIGAITGAVGAASQLSLGIAETVLANQKATLGTKHIDELTQALMVLTRSQAILQELDTIMEGDDAKELYGKQPAFAKDVEQVWNKIADDIAQAESRLEAMEGAALEDLQTQVGQLYEEAHQLVRGDKELKKDHVRGVVAMQNITSAALIADNLHIIKSTGWKTVADADLKSDGPMTSTVRQLDVDFVD